jgi:hypothetical protein
MYFEAIGQMKKQLGQLDKWLDTAAKFAQAKSFDPNAFLAFRLAPDQFAFARQVQTACDMARLIASRLSGREEPKQGDEAKTLDELHAYVQAAVSSLGGFHAADFAQAATRVITQPRWEGKSMSGADYFLEHGLPNFYFHLTTAYAILRHNGVDVGKRDYLGPLTFRPTA